MLTVKDLMKASDVICSEKETDVEKYLGSINFSEYMWRMLRLTPNNLTDNQKKVRKLFDKMISHFNKDRTFFIGHVEKSARGYYLSSGYRLESSIISLSSRFKPKYGLSEGDWVVGRVKNNLIIDVKPLVRFDNRLLLKQFMLQIH